MASVLSNQLRAPSQFVSTVTSKLQFVRTARQLIPQKYFHPWKKLSTEKQLDGERSPLDSPIPPYPYGPNRIYPAADTGLYGGATVQSGNKISKGRNKGKTRRRWYPNVRVEKLRSEALNKEFTLKVTASCMRTIQKCGGLDQYLLGTKPARIKELGLLGWRLRWRVMNSPSMRMKFEQERASLGLPKTNPLGELFEDVWANKARRERLINLQSEAWQRLREKNERFEKHTRNQWKAIMPSLENPRLSWRRRQPVLMHLDPKNITLETLPSVRNQWQGKGQGSA